MKNTSLKEFLIQSGFFKIKLHAISSNHYKIVASVNGVKGWFILDTGASTTFLSQSACDQFKLELEDNSIRAHGAGSDYIEAQISIKNTIAIGRWKTNNCKLALINLSPINSAFEKVNLKAIDGIIGADLLKKGSAVIDYESNYLYLK